MRHSSALVFAASFSSLFLAACGGGGGGGGTSATLSPFVQFSSIAVPGTTRMNGSSQEATYTYNTGTQTVTNVSGATSPANGTLDLTYGSSGGLPTKVNISSGAGTNISFNTANGDSIGALFSDVDVAVSANGQNYVLTADPTFYGWDYQSFGVWLTGAGTGSGTVGAISAGAETSGSAVPTSGTATYTGVTAGRYVNATGSDFFTYSSMSAAANFAARTLAFSTSSSITSPDLGTFSSNTNLNMSGSLSYSAGSNQFSGTVNTVGGGAGNASMTGTATGKFYGPSAQEIGGTFSVSNGSAAMIGAFGGKR